MSWFIGNAGYAFFDYWTIMHLSFWLVTGSTIAAVKLDSSCKDKAFDVKREVMMRAAFGT